MVGTLVSPPLCPVCSTLHGSPSFLPRINHGDPENILGRKGQTWGIVAPSASGSGVMEMECTTGSRQRGLPFRPSVAPAQGSEQLIWWLMTSRQDEDGRQEEGQWRVLGSYIKDLVHRLLPEEENAQI